MDFLVTSIWRILVTDSQTHLCDRSYPRAFLPSSIIRFLVAASSSQRVGAVKVPE